MRYRLAYHVPVGAGVDHGIDDDVGAGNRMDDADGNDRPDDAVLCADDATGRCCC